LFELIPEVVIVFGTELRFLLGMIPQPKHIALPNANSHKVHCSQPIKVMSASMPLEEKFEALMKSYKEIRVPSE